MRDLYLLLLKHRRMLISDLVNLMNTTRDVLINKLKLINGYVNVSEHEVVLNKPLDLALYLLRNGYSVKEVSKYLDWRDFEKVTSEILSQNNYMVLTNFKSTYPVKLEIDVIGVEPASGRGLFIDCKHWSRGIASKSLLSIVDKHVERIEKFIKYYNWFRNKWLYFKYIKSILPMIITLTTPSVRVYRNTLVVSIQELNNVLIDIYNVVDTFNIEFFKIRE